MPSRVSIVAQFVAIGLVWGSSFLFMKVGLTGLSFGQVAWARLVLGAIALGVVVVVTRQRLPRERIVWLHFAVIAVTNCVIPYLSFAWAEQFVPSGLASIYNATTPIMTALMAGIAFGVERLRAGQVLGIVVGIVGVVVIIAPWTIAAFTSSLAGQLACLVATLCYGFSFGYARTFLSARPIPGGVYAFLNIGIAAVIMLMLTPLVAWSPVLLDLPVVLAMLALGVLGTGFAYIWNIAVLRAWGPTPASTVTYITPVVGVALGIIVLGETLSWNEPVGAVVVIVGILFAQGRIRLPSRAPVRSASQ